MFCLLVVRAKLSLLAKWLARKTPVRKPNRGDGIISIKPRPKSAHVFLCLLYCFIVLLCICVVSCPYVRYYPTVMARYSLFVLKVPLNPKQTNKQCCCAVNRNQTSKPITSPSPEFLQVACPSCCPTNIVEVLEVVEYRDMLLTCSADESYGFDSEILIVSRWVVDGVR